MTSTETPAAGAASNTANLVVLAPPTFTKGFAPATIHTGATSVLTFTVTNPTPDRAHERHVQRPVDEHDARQRDRGRHVRGRDVRAGARGGGTQVNPTIPTLAGGASCTITVNVTSTAQSNAGGHVNTAGPISSTQTPTGGLTATANLVVVSPPLVTKTFVPTVVATNAPSTLTFTITNPNPVALSGVAFQDTFPTTPAQMVVSNPVNLTNSCGGVVDENDAADADNTLEAVDRSVRFTGGAVAANSSCTITVNVQAPTAGTYTNNITAVTSTQTPTATTGGTDFLNVSDLNITKEFCSNLPPATPVGATCTPVTDVTVGTVFNMWITVNNPTATNNINDIFWTDNLPAGMTTSAGDIFISRVAGQCDEVPNPIPNEAGGATRITASALVLSVPALVVVCSSGRTPEVQPAVRTRTQRASSRRRITSMPGSSHMPAVRKQP